VEAQVNVGRAEGACL